MCTSRVEGRRCGTASAQLRQLADSDRSASSIYLSVRAKVVGLLRGHGRRVTNQKRMWRMALDARLFARRARAGTTGTRASSGAVGLPPFFDTARLRHSVYCGIREGGGMVAAAGTHVRARQAGVADIGKYARGRLGFRRRCEYLEGIAKASGSIKSSRPVAS